MAKKTTSQTKRADQPSGDDIDFETSLTEVESIVAKLESGQLNLTESMSQYEIGIRRLKQCHRLLEAAEQRVSLLAGFDAEGNPIIESLQPETGGRGQSKRRVAKKATAGEDADPAESGESSVDDSPGLF